jgi:hypothetical protein
MDPCHRGMLRPWIADGGEDLHLTKSSCEYFKEVADSRQGVVLQLGGCAESDEYRQ